MPAPARATHSMSSAPARSGHGDRERADELDGHRDPERDPLERLVEAQVHAGEHEAEDGGEPQLPAGAPA